MNEGQSNNIPPQPTLEPSQRQPSYRFILMGGIIGFVLGVLGNLVAAWLQEVVLANSFTPGRIGAIGVVTVVGLLGAAWWDRRQSIAGSSFSLDEDRPQNDNVQMSWIQLWWSKLKIRGRGTKMKGVSSLGSKIDIDTRDNP